MAAFFWLRGQDLNRQFKTPGETRTDKQTLKILSAGAPVDFKDDSPTKQRHPDISSGGTWPIIR